MAAEHSEIPAAFDYEPRFAGVDGERMHYVDAGAGRPLLFVHGNPTWSYLWRNVLPWLTPHGRCIAPDLIGMGRSDKPDLRYRFFDHADYLDGFIERLGLDDVTLVGHDWGSALGLHWARRHPERVRALALVEAILMPYEWAEFPWDFRLGFRAMRTPGLGWLSLSLVNGFVEVGLPAGTLRRLSRAEMAHYRAPFPSVRSRRPIRRWPREMPIGGRPADVVAAVAAYNAYLRTSEVPKLLLYARPGANVRERSLEWARGELAQLETADVGPGIHFVQEDRPHVIGDALADWFRRLD